MNDTEKDRPAPARTEESGCAGAEAGNGSAATAEPASPEQAPDGAASPEPLTPELASSMPAPTASATAAPPARASTAPVETEPAPDAAARVAQPASSAKSAFVAAYEHPSAVRFCHWLNAIVLLIMVTSGWRIFIAFPSFGPRVPEKVFLNIPESITLGGWLGGALQWHLTFAWMFVATGAVYVAYLAVSGQYKTMLFRARDIPGVWPMVRHYFFFGPAPRQTEAYNPLQKLAYTTIVVCGALSALTGLVLLRPVQFSTLTWLMGGFHLARVWHFIAMCGFVAFIPGHLLMVALHGWNNFMSMVSGWKKNPEYLRQ